MKKLKSSCCEKYRRKPKACKSCPVFALLGKKQRKKRLKKLHKQLAKAA